MCGGYLFATTGRSKPVPQLSRRRLLQSAGAAVTAAFAAEFLPPNVRRALAAGPAHGGSLSDIKHVVILMQENRSFDHYFGTLPNVRGFADPKAITLPDGKPVFYQPDAGNPDGYLLPFHLDTRTTSAQAQPSTSHAWAVQHSAWDGGKMDNWLPAHLAADGADGPYTMGYLERDDIPFHFALAENFTICDNYHCSVLGPTWPNRLYLMSAWIDPEGAGGGPIISNVDPTPYTWKTYPEALTSAGVSWKVYQEVDNYECNLLEMFASFQAAPVGSPLYQNGLRTYTEGQFEYDAIHDKLPTVSWLIPTSFQSEHPDYTPAAGADFVVSKIDAIAANPGVWNKNRLHPQLRRERRNLRPRGAAHRAGRDAGRIRGRAADRRRLPGAVPHRLAVDAGRLDREPDLRPHLGAALPRAPDRRAHSQHQRLATGHLRRPDLGVRRGCGAPEGTRWPQACVTRSDLACFSRRYERW